MSIVRFSVAAGLLFGACSGAPESIVDAGRAGSDAAAEKAGAGGAVSAAGKGGASAAAGKGGSSAGGHKGAAGDRSAGGGASGKAGVGGTTEAGGSDAGTPAGDACDPLDPHRDDNEFKPCLANTRCRPGFDEQATCADKPSEGQLLAEGSQCAIPNDCADGLDCSIDRVCTPYCRLNTDCPSERPICVKNFSRFGSSLDDAIGSCYSLCDPSNPTLDDETFDPCPEGQYCGVNDRVSLCRAPTGAVTLDGACVVDADCVPGLGCHNDRRLRDATGKCAPKCRVEENQCPESAPLCLNFGERAGPIAIGTCSVGGCDPVAPETDNDVYTPCAEALECQAYENASGCVTPTDGSLGVGDTCFSTMPCSGSLTCQSGKCLPYCREDGDCPTDFPACDKSPGWRAADDDEVGFCNVR